MASRSSSLGAAALAAVLGLVTIGAQTPADEASALAARAGARIRELQREADRLAAEARTVFGDLRRLELERSIAREQVAQADAELAQVTGLRDKASARVAELEAERVAETPGLTVRLTELYKRGRGGYLQLLLASDDVRAFGRMTRGVAALAELDRARVEAHRRTVAAERAALADLETQRTAVAAKQRDAAQARAGLDRAVAARNQLIDDLDHRRDLAAQYVGELQAAQAALQRTIAGVASGDAAPALPIRPFRGALDWPVTGRVTAGFGRAATGRFGTAVVRNGIDVAAPEDTPVLAVHEGTVAYAEPFTGFGVLVIVDHGDDAFSLYGNLATATVARGDRVRRGNEIGTVGLAPAGGSALYFELRIDGRPVDPLQWLRSSR